MTTNASGASVASGYELEVVSGGTATSTTVNSGGLLQVDSGGSETSATILAGGSANYLGNASGDTISGTVVVPGQNSGTATNVVLTSETVYGGGVISSTATGAQLINTVVNGGSVYITKSATMSATTIENGGTVTLNSAKALLTGGVTMSGTNNTIQILTLNPVQSGSSYGDTSPITGFASGDVLDVRPLSGGMLSLANNGAGNTTLTLTGTSGGVSATETFTLAGSATNYSNLMAVSDGNGGTEVVACFVAGTAIRTDRGDVAVEALRIGDLVATTSGALRPVRWLGHRRIDGRGHSRPADAMPVRICAHAFRENCPTRDLWLSPHHAVCIDVLGEVLIPAIGLINGTTIQQVDAESVTYWHVELDSHDIILAENLPTESYIDVGNRAFFAEADVTALDALPDAVAPSTAGYCRPFHPADGSLVAVARDQLRRRAEALGWRLEPPAAPDDLWLEVDGLRIDPVRDGLVARAALPATARDVVLCSSVAVPTLTTPGDTDARRLGLPLAGLVVDDGLHCRREIACGDERLVEGFYPSEGAFRWSDGRARLPAELWEGVAGDFFLRIAIVAPALPRWVAPVAEREASAELFAA